MCQDIQSDVSQEVLQVLGELLVSENIIVFILKDLLDGFNIILLIG